MSTEEAKAKELIDKFTPLVRTPRFGKRHADPYYLAREAAVICVDEILNVIQTEYPTQEEMKIVNFWKSVRLHHKPLSYEYRK